MRRQMDSPLSDLPPSCRPNFPLARCLDTDNKGLFTAPGDALTKWPFKDAASRPPSKAICQRGLNEDVSYRSGLGSARERLGLGRGGGSRGCQGAGCSGEIENTSLVTEPHSKLLSNRGRARPTCTRFSLFLLREPGCSNASNTAGAASGCALHAKGSREG